MKDALKADRKVGKRPGASLRVTRSRRSCISSARAELFLAVSIDIGEQGLALQTTESVPMSSNLAFRCVLPGTDISLQGHADVMWASDQGRAGLFFTKMSPAARKHLKQWLHKRAHGKAKEEHGVREVMLSEDDHVSYALSE